MTGLVGLGAVGYAIYGYTISALSVAPTEAVIRQGVPCSADGNAKAKNFQVISTHKWSKGVVVLYSALCPTDNRPKVLQRIFGHKVVKQEGMRWQISGSDSYGADSTPGGPENLVNYGISKSANQSGDRYTILYGQVISAKVSAVEVTFDNGRTLRDESSNGVFALVASGATAVCELRVFGADNQILQQEELAVPREVADGQPPHQCLPASHQL